MDRFQGRHAAARDLKRRRLHVDEVEGMIHAPPLGDRQPDQRDEGTHRQDIGCREQLFATAGRGSVPRPRPSRHRHRPHRRGRLSMDAGSRSIVRVS